MRRDGKTGKTVSQTIAPAVYTATATGTGVDTRGYDQITFLVQAGDWTDGDFQFDVQESDDDSSYSSAAAADIVGTEPRISSESDDDQDYVVGYVGAKRYVRMVATAGSPQGGTGTAFGCSVILEKAARSGTTG